MEYKISNMKEIIINHILIPSLQRLYQIDFDNIKNGVSERNICARLSLHMENLMREYDRKHNAKFFECYYADVEYNRMGNGEMKKYENSEHRPQYMVSDLLIQSRGQERNLLAVEMKRAGNKKHVDDDKKRLESLVSSPGLQAISNQCVHDTLVGAFIEYAPNGIKIDFFENVDGKGVLTEHLEYGYDQLVRHCT